MRSSAPHIYLTFQASAHQSEKSHNRYGRPAQVKRATQNRPDNYEANCRVLRLGIAANHRASCPRMSRHHTITNTIRAVADDDDYYYYCLKSRLCRTGALTHLWTIICHGFAGFSSSPVPILVAPACGWTAGSYQNATALQGCRAQLAYLVTQGS